MRCLVVYDEGDVLEMRNRRGEDATAFAAMPSRQVSDGSVIASRASGAGRSSTGS